MTQSAKRKFRFSLRALLVFITLLGIWLGWQVNAARKQRRAVAALRNSPGTIGYDYQYRPGNPPPARPPQFDLGLTQTNIPDLNVIPPGPVWLRQQLGEDYFQTAVAVTLMNGTVQPPALEELANLPRLKVFCLGWGGTRDEHLQAFAELGDLEVLQINNTPIDGSVLALLPNPQKLRSVSLHENDLDDRALVSIGKMVNLLSLTLRNERITDAALENLRNLSKLETLDLRDTDISDAGLANVRNLRKLIILSLQRTQVTDAGLQELNELKSLRLLSLAGTKTTSEGIQPCRRHCQTCIST